MTDIISHSVTILFVVFILGAVVYELYTTFKEKKESFWNPTEEDLNNAVKACETAIDKLINKDGCTVKVCGSSSWCEDCGLTWDTNDIDPPLCEKSFLCVDVDKPEELIYFGDITSTQQLSKFKEALKRDGTMKEDHYLVVKGKLASKRPRILPEVNTSTPMPAVKPPRMTSESVSSPTPICPTGDGENGSEDNTGSSGVIVNRGTPDKYTQEASESLTLDNLEVKVKEEIKRMEDWK